MQTATGTIQHNKIQDKQKGATPLIWGAIALYPLGAIPPTTEPLHCTHQSERNSTNIKIDRRRPASQKNQEPETQADSVKRSPPLYRKKPKQAAGVGNRSIHTTRMSKTLMYPEPRVKSPESVTTLDKNHTTIREKLDPKDDLWKRNFPGIWRSP